MTTMKPLLLLLHLVLVLFATILTPVLSSSYASSSSSSSMDFIRASCSSTLYPDICVSSLARYANAVNQSPLALARVAAAVSLDRIQSVRAHVSSLAHVPASSSDSLSSAALRDCAGLLGNAADQTKSSSAELANMGAASSGPKAAWEMSNVQTWMSAALTNEDTCIDGFQGVGASRVKDDVLRRVARTKQFSSNALALANKLSH